MKKIYLISFLAFFAHSLVHAQATFLTMDSVNINRINAAVLVHGDMWWNGNSSVYLTKCKFPNGTGKSIGGFGSALWMSAYDDAGTMHVAAQTYRQNGSDYWPGPLGSADTLTYHLSHDWAKIWKVNRTDIQYFQSLSSHDAGNTPTAILTWPGKGNSNAIGNGGAALTIDHDMAPFIDLNGNGIYEPLSGEYPDIKGDQALWWVFSDNGPVHSETNGKPLGVEVRAMSYAYSRGTLIDNVVYYDFNIVNRSASNYHDFRAGLRADFDLGYYLDDYQGFDSSHRMGIIYNGSNDDGASAGNPEGSYGTHMPVVGVTLVSVPGDAAGSYVPVGSCVKYQNDVSVIGNPAADTEYNFYLRARRRNGTHFTNDFMGRGLPSYGTGTGPDCNYLFTGEPYDTLQWSECACSNLSGDRIFILASNDFTLNAGSEAHIVMALVATDPDSNNSCPGLSFDGIRTVADTAWGVYNNPLPQLPAAVTGIAADHTVNIYPNPVHDRLFVNDAASAYTYGRIMVYNAIGQQMNVAIDKSSRNYSVDVRMLPAGLYYVKYNNRSVDRSVKFIKE